MATERQKGAPLPTIRRLPAYLRLLKQMHQDGRDFISSTHIADDLRLEAIQVRKDLQVTGIEGRTRVGYHLPELICAIEAFLGWDNSTDAFLVGAGSLGTALMGHDGFAQHGFNIVVAFDSEGEKVGRRVHGIEVLPLSKLPDLAQRMRVRMGIIATPAAAAQEVVNLMVSAGILGIWNFAPIRLQVPKPVVVQNEDLSSGLAVLSHKLAEAIQREENV